MLSAETFSGISNGSAFNHHIFGEISRPLNGSVIDLSSEEETEGFGPLSNHRKRQHHSTENLNSKRKHKEIENVKLYNDSQKNRNRNVPLKKRGASNREEELNFLNLIASEDSNHAQSTKIGSLRDVTSTCDSTTNTTNQKFYHELEPKDRNGNSSISKSNCSNDHNKSKKNTENNSICNCLECFPNLGSGGIRSNIKCKKLDKTDLSGNSSISSSSMTTKNSPSTSSSLRADLSLVPGPSGIQKPIKGSVITKEQQNFFDSDDDYDSDEQPMPKSEVVKTDDLTAPHLQLDWSDSSDEDNDVIFVNDRSEPIDLTADSDNDNKTQSSLDASKKSIDNRSIGEHTSENRSNSSMSYHSLWPPPSISSTALSISPRNSIVTLQRPPIVSSAENTIILPTPPIIPPPTILPSSTASRQINFQEVITGNDVMLFEGAQNFSTNSSRTRITSDISNNESRQENISNQIRESNQNNYVGNNIGSNNHNIYHRRSTHHHTAANFHHNPSSYRVEDLTSQSNNVQPSTQSNSRGVVRCPYLTEGHHYNRPSRRLAREFYPIRQNYAVHEDLWRRQYQEQEIRRQYWSTGGFNETPEVQVHMVHMDPTSSIPHRLVTNMNENNSNDIFNRYRMQRSFLRRSW